MTQVAGVSSGNMSNVVMAFVGVCVALMGVICLLVVAIGDFSTGRTAFAATGVSLLIVAMPFFAFLYSRKIAKALGAIVLLAFAGAMLWLSFRPDNPSPDPTIYQVAAVALGVLSVTRIGLMLRGKKRRPGA